MYPIIVETADRKLEDFLSHESKRVKLATPDLGELLILLCLSTNITWEDIAMDFLQECFDRNVMWILDMRSGGHGELAYLESDPISEYRLNTTFEAAKTSLRLLMFQAFFFHYVAKPKGKTRQEILSEYRSSYGFPPAGLAVKLQQACWEIHQVNKWKDFYWRVNVMPPSQTTLTSILREAVRR